MIDDATSVRRLRERDTSRHHADMLARAVKRYLANPTTRERLLLYFAVQAYRRAEAPV